MLGRGGNGKKSRNWDIPGTFEAVIMNEKRGDPDS
jgi:hypothetical protein